MKRFLFNIFLTGILSILLYPLLVIGSELPIIDEFSRNFIEFKKGGNGHLWTRLKEADTTKKVDVLILGSSLAYRGIDTRKFEERGLRAFNLGSSSQTQIQTEYLLNRYLEKMKPEYVIWDVNPGSFAISGLESFIDLLSNCDDCVGLGRMMIELNSFVGFNAYLKKEILMRDSNPNFTEPIIMQSDTYIRNGYVETSRSLKSELEKDIFEIEFLKQQQLAFESGINMLASKGIKVFVVFSPKSDPYLKSFSNSEEFFTFFRKIVKAGLAEDFLNFSEILPEFGANPRFFYDEIHLTSQGVNIYNDALLEVISERISSRAKHEK